MRFYRTYRKFYIWLICLAVFFIAYFCLRQSRTAMNRLCGRVLLPLEQSIGRLWGYTSVSMAEVLIISLLCAAFFYVVWGVRRMIANPKKGKSLGCLLMTLVCGGLSVYAGFCLLWGTFYNTDSFQEQSGLAARGGTAAELTALTEQFAGYVRESADSVPRDASGKVDLTVAEVLSQAPDSYHSLCEEFPFLKAETAAPKAFTSSRALSALNFTGFYFPFTGEANVNIDAPVVYLPVTCCHEIAHQKGISSEQECNFLGILAALRYEDVSFRYSGALMGYVYLSNALYRTDYDAWKTIRDTLPESALQDLQQQSAYWAQFEGPVKTVSTRIYDGFLKTNGDPNGIKSYGMVVDLLLAYGGNYDAQ